MSIDIAGFGLRAMKKERTRQALGEAAVAIVAAEGIDALTADRIAAEAGVSRRTLFNYFSRVEDVLTASMEQTTQETIAAFVARPSTEPLRDSVAAVLSRLLDDPAFTQALVLERAAVSSPATRRFLREFTDTQIDALEAGLRDRIGADADPVYVSALAASAGAILTRMTRHVVARMPDVDPADPRLAQQHHEAIRRSFDLLFAGFDEASATITATDVTDPATREG